LSLPPEPKRTVFEDDLARLRQQREQSDSRYDEALTALDKALWTPPEFPPAPPSPDETQVTPLNTRWDILRARPALPGGWRGRLARVVWSIVEPLFAEQQAFNSAVVDHMNRNIPAQREVTTSIELTIATLRQQVEQLCAFHSVLLRYLQRVTAFVNSKDYEFDALSRRRYEDVLQDLHDFNRSLHGLTAAVQGLTNEFLKHVESLTSTVQRNDRRIETFTTALAIVQQQAVVLQRELSRRDAPAGDRQTADADRSHPREEAGAIARSATLAGDSAVESWKYPAFEAAFRGSEADVASRLSAYLPLFAGAQNVLDVGCGRGEFLSLLQREGIAASGIDLNREMVEMCRTRGLDVFHGEALSYLRGLPDQALGGLFAAQVVEHLPPDYLLAFLNEAHRVLRPGAPLVLETVNVACWYAFFQSYVRDITHAKPLHPDTLTHLVIASGFPTAELQWRVPVDATVRLQPMPAGLGDDKIEDTALRALVHAIDANIERLNALLFTYMDYAVIARK
jgi:O-antigen chain-terminating methyltransferase